MEPNEELPTEETYDKVLGRLLLESAKDQLKWIKSGIVGISVFFICLGALGVIALARTIF